MEHIGRVPERKALRHPRPGNTVVARADAA